jgi:hypothetical protein
MRPKNERVHTMLTRRLAILALVLAVAITTGQLMAQQDEGPILRPKKPVAKPAGATLLVMCDLACKWKLDGEAKGSIEAGGSAKAKVERGQHLVVAATEDGLDKLESETEVKTAAQTIVRLELKPVRDARLKAEQETAALREKAAAAERQRLQAEQEAAAQREKEQAAADERQRAQYQPAAAAGDGQRQQTALNGSSMIHSGFGRVHGNVINPTGAAQMGGTVSLSTDGGRTSSYTFQLDSTGAYSGEAAAGRYTLIFRQIDTPPDKMVDSIKGVDVIEGYDVKVDDDMSRNEFIARLPAESRRQLEEIRSHNVNAISANETIKNLNNDLRQVTADIHDAEATTDKQVKKTKYSEIESLMQKDTRLRPQEPVLWAYLGLGQAGLANLDPATSKDKYDEAETAYKKTIDLSQTAKAAKPDILAMAHAGLGEVYARQAKVPEANAEYYNAAKADSSKAAMYLRNETVIFSQIGNRYAQAAAADEAIKVNPNDPILYYLKGQGLVESATIDPRSQKIILPPGCGEAYRRYLELAPNGPYAANVKGILAQAQ